MPMLSQRVAPFFVMPMPGSAVMPSAAPRLRPCTAAPPGVMQLRCGGTCATTNSTTSAMQHVATRGRRSACHGRSRRSTSSRARSWPRMTAPPPSTGRRSPGSTRPRAAARSTGCSRDRAHGATPEAATCAGQHEGPRQPDVACPSAPPDLPMRVARPGSSSSLGTMAQSAGSRTPAARSAPPPRNRIRRSPPPRPAPLSVRSIGADRRVQRMVALVLRRAWTRCTSRSAASPTACAVPVLPPLAVRRASEHAGRRALLRHAMQAHGRISSTWSAASAATWSQRAVVHAVSFRRSRHRRPLRAPAAAGSAARPTGQRGGGAGHLQHREVVVALADAQRNGFAGVPALLFGLLVDSASSTRWTAARRSAFAFEIDARCGWPKPNGDRCWCIRSTPISLASE